MNGRAASGAVRPSIPLGRISCARQMASNSPASTQLEFTVLGVLRQPTSATRLPTGARARVFGCCSSRKTVGESPPGGTGWADAFRPAQDQVVQRRSVRDDDAHERERIFSSVACQRQDRWRNNSTNGAFIQEGFRLPVIQSQHRAHLPLRERPAHTLQSPLFHDVTAYVPGFSPLTGT